MKKILDNVLLIFIYIIVAVEAIVIITLCTANFSVLHITGVSNSPTMSSNTTAFALNIKPKRLDFACIQRKVLGANGIVKRVIGLPGETIEIIEGIVYINDQPLDEPYARYLSEEDKLNYNYDRTKLGSNEYFVLGDNRNKSFDSEDFGPVKVEKLEYTVIYWYDSRK